MQPVVVTTIMAESKRACAMLREGQPAFSLDARNGCKQSKTVNPVRMERHWPDVHYRLSHDTAYRSLCYERSIHFRLDCCHRCSRRALYAAERDCDARGSTTNQFQIESFLATRCLTKKKRPVVNIHEHRPFDLTVSCAYCSSQYRPHPGTGGVPQHIKNFLAAASHTRARRGGVGQDS
jgi:hypothetical protein